MKRIAACLSVLLMFAGSALADPPASRPSGIIVQAKVVRGVSAKPATQPEQWVIDAVKALPVERRNNELPPEFVESVMDWQLIPLAKPTSFDVRGMKVTATVRRDGQSLDIRLVMEQGDARAVSQLAVDAAPGSRKAMQVSSNLDGERGYLVVQVLAAPATQPADAPLVITNADDGKTVVAHVGQAIKIKLENTHEGAGWEVGYDRNGLKAIIQIKPEVAGLTDPRFKACVQVGLNDFVPADPNDPKGVAATVGTYVWAFNAVAVGEEKLDFMCIAPGGPFAVQRLRSARVGQFSVTVKVEAAAATQPSKRAAERAEKLKGRREDVHLIAGLQRRAEWNGCVALLPPAAKRAAATGGR